MIIQRLPTPAANYSHLYSTHYIVTQENIKSGTIQTQVRFQFLTAVNTKITVFWDVELCRKQ
jgi:hypothetical protein